MRLSCYLPIVLIAEMPLQTILVIWLVTAKIFFNLSYEEYTHVSRFQSFLLTLTYYYCFDAFFHSFFFHSFSLRAFFLFVCLFLPRFHFIYLLQQFVFLPNRHIFFSFYLHRFFYSVHLFNYLSP